MRGGPDLCLLADPLSQNQKLSGSLCACGGLDSESDVTRLSVTAIRSRQTMSTTTSGD